MAEETLHESSRLARPDRIARIAARAEILLGSTQRAVVWLTRANRALGGAMPLDLLETDAGLDQVEVALGRLEYGVYS